MTGTGFTLRGAMNADNPDTAKIINSLLSGLMQQGISAVPDKNAQTILQMLKMTTNESEVVWEADIPEKIVTDFIRSKPETPTIIPATRVTKPPVSRKRTRKN